MENIEIQLQSAIQNRNMNRVRELMELREKNRNTILPEEEEEERCGGFDQINAISSEFCNGKVDPILREVIQDGDGVCVRGNCYSRASILESILTNSFNEPFTTRPFTMDSFGYEYHRNMVDTLRSKLQELQTRYDISLDQNEFLVEDSASLEASLSELELRNGSVEHNLEYFAPS